MPTLEEAVKIGFEYHRKGDLHTASQVYDQILCQIDRPDPNVLYGYGSLLIAQEKYGLGIALLQAANSLATNHAPLLVNLGVAYKRLSKYQQAMECFTKALEINPDSPEALTGMAGYWINRANPEEAERYARRAIELSDDGGIAAGARMNLGVALLEQCRYEEGWPHYEYRWESVERLLDKRPYQCPKWTGEKVQVLAIHGEQGLGDEIFFMALFREAAKRADRVVVECAGRLVTLFRDAFGVPCYPDHASLIANEGEPSAYIPMGSLPSVLGFPDGKPYMPRPKAEYTGRQKIGIAWRGGTSKTNTNERSLELEALKPIFETARWADFVSVQYGGGDVDIEAALHGLEIGPRDFDSLQWRIGTCDLIITVCQTAVHQAGAMGVPCWVLTPHKGSWMFCGDTLKRFYESTKLYRQGPDDQWAPVIEAIAHDLRGHDQRAA